MRRHLPTLAALAVSATLLLSACGGDDSDADAAEDGSSETTAAPTDDAATVEDGSAGGGVGDGTWLMAGQRYEPDVLSCTVITNDDGTTLEVVAQGAIASSGESYAQLRLVDSPPSIGDASIVVAVEDDEYRVELEPSGGTTGETDDLFWEVDGDGTFFLLGSFPVAGTDVDIDLQVGCEELGSVSPSSDDGDDEDAAGASGGEASGTLVVDGTPIDVAGTCSYDPAGGSSADVASGTFTGGDGDEYGVVFGVSGDSARNSQVTVSTPDDRVAVRWEPDGTLTQSSADGVYMLTAGRLVIDLDAGIALDVECAER